MRILREMVKFVFKRLHLIKGRNPALNEARNDNHYCEAWLSSEIPEQKWAIAQPHLQRIQIGDATPEFCVFIRRIL